MMFWFFYGGGVHKEEREMWDCDGLLWAGVESEIGREKRGRKRVRQWIWKRTDGWELEEKKKKQKRRREENCEKESEQNVC